jgi:hypothetical protein
MAAGVLGGDEVPEVDRVERAAEDADACRGHARQYGMGEGGCQARGGRRLRSAGWTENSKRQTTNGNDQRNGDNQATHGEIPRLRSG